MESSKDQLEEQAYNEAHENAQDPVGFERRKASELRRKPFENLPKSKDALMAMMEAVILDVKGGDVSALEIMSVATRLKFLADEMKKAVNPLALEEIDKFSSKEKVSWGGVDFVPTTKTIYDYAACEDSEWEGLGEVVKESKEIAKKAGERLKKRETFLKALPIEGTVNPETGELIMQAHPSGGSNTITCTIRKS